MSDPGKSLPQLLEQLGREDRLGAGQTLWHEGGPGDEVILLKEGVLEITRETSEGVTLVLRQVEAEAVLGEIACLDGRDRSAGIRASTECRVYRYDAASFRDLLHERPAILEDLLLDQVDRVRSLTGQVARTHHRAITDPLTKLYNIGFFNERLGLELARARQTGDLVSIVMFDLDHFKQYNDSHGHQVGNDALVELSRLMKDAGRRGDVVARYGGEEFVILLYGANREEAWRFADQVRKRVSEAPFLGAESQPLGSMTLSGGVATFPDDADDPETLLVRADANLYLAKMAGRNRVISDPSQTAQE